MKRALFTLAAALSFVACAAAAGAWAASAATGRPLGCARMTTDGTFVDGRALFVCDGLFEVGRTREPLFPGAPLGTNRIEVITGRGSRSAGWADYGAYHAVRVPAWLAVLVTALLPTRWAYLVLKQRHGKGFDVRLPPDNALASHEDQSPRTG